MGSSQTVLLLHKFQLLLWCILFTFENKCNNVENNICNYNHYRRVYATLQGMDIGFLPLCEKILNFYKNASINDWTKTLFVSSINILLQKRNCSTYGLTKTTWRRIENQQHAHHNTTSKLGKCLSFSLETKLNRRNHRSAFP